MSLGMDANLVLGLLKFASERDSIAPPRPGAALPAQTATRMSQSLPVSMAQTASPAASVDI